MKFSIVVVCSFLVFFRDVAGGELKLPDEIVDLLKNLSNACIAEVGIAESMVAEMRKGKLVEDPKAKCYLKCMMRQLQTMNEEGNLDIDLIDASMPDILREHGGMETVHKCKHIHEADMCETAFKILMCFQKENPALNAMFE